MTDVRVIAPVALIKDATGAIHYCYSGAIVDFASDVNAQHLLALNLVEAFDASTPVVHPPVEAANGSAVGALERPKHTAPVKAWEDYAAALFESTNGEQGLSRKDAEAATKQDLIELLS